MLKRKSNKSSEQGLSIFPLELPKISWQFHVSLSQLMQVS